MELTLRGICKSFGAGNVLDGVDLSIRGGEICALLGENGAGKSTLMNIVGGVIAADAGEILLDGKKVVFPTPAASLRAGIAFIHQERNLVDDLTVYENMFLSGLPRKGLFLDRDLMIRKTREVFDRIGVALDPCALVGTLDASYKQTVEIARALLSEASLIIMDEPTSSLSPAEIERIFGIMRTLRERGFAMIFISHKLGEVMEICDRYTVLRNGTLVKSGKVCDVTPRELASFMVGHEIAEKSVRSSPTLGEEIFALKGLSDRKHFFDISLSVRQGEILGVTGLLGDGRSELFGTVFGIYGKDYDGEILCKGEPIHPASPGEALAHGIAYLPKDRQDNAIFPHMSILDNGTAATLREYRDRLLLSFDKRRAAFDAQAKALRIKMPGTEEPITALSGGNQQKTVLAKWLLASPQVLILDNPTQGVDVGAKEEIYAIIHSLAESGIAVIVLSSEVQEILRVCDRSIVLYHGRRVGEVVCAESNEEGIMYLATGAGRTEKNGTEQQ